MTFIAGFAAGFVAAIVVLGLLAWDLRRDLPIDDGM